MAFQKQSDHENNISRTLPLLSCRQQAKTFTMLFFMMTTDASL